MKIGVLHNCQNAGIAASLRALLPDAEVINYEASQALPDKEQQERAAALSACDHLFMAHMALGYGRLSFRALEKTARQVHLLPAFVFSGYHPDMCYVHVDGRALNNVTGGYQSRIAVVGYLAGLSPRAVAGLYNKLVFARLGYFGAFATQSALLLDQWAANGIDARPLLARWTESGCFAYSINHPKMPVLLDLARIACAWIGVAVRNGVEAASLPDDLAHYPRHPLFPDIADALGIPPEGDFSAGKGDGTRAVFSPAEFAARCFEEFARVPPSALLAALGVKDAMAALGLAQRRHDVARPRPGPGMVLMTYHGTLLRAGPAPGQMSHFPLTVPAAQAPLLRANGAIAGARQAGGALDGAELRHAGSGGRVTLWRAGKFLCAERDSATASFSREGAGEWEHFLLLHEASAIALARLLQADWSLPDTAALVAQESIRVEAGPVLRLGKWVTELALHAPREEGDGVVVLLDGEPCLLREVTRPPVLVRVGLPEPGKRLVLVGAPAWLPPPVTMCAADRDWVYRAAVSPATLNGRVQAADAVLRRGADQRVGPEESGLAFPGLSVRFWPEGGKALGWMDAAIRLQVLAAVAPEGAFLVPDGVAPDALQALRALGFQDVTFQPVGATGGVAADLLWLDNTEEASLPAEALAGLRARVGAPPGGVKKLFWRDGVAPGLEPMLAAQGFDIVDPAALPIVAQIALVSQAAWVVGASGRIPLAFCPPGARVVELSDAAAFVGRDWALAVKLGLMHGVLPCANSPAGVAPDWQRLAVLLRLLSTRL